MKFSLNNFLYALKQIVTGSNAVNAGGLPGVDGGYNEDVTLDLLDVTLGSGTTAVTVSNTQALSNAATNTSFGNISYLIPRDYDEASDKLLVRLIARTAGTTDFPTLTVASSTSVLGGTVGVAGTSKTSAVVTSSTAVYEFNLSGQGLKRDTNLALLMTMGAHTTDAIQLFAVQIVYASTIVSFIDGNDAVGNPLR